ncbi:MAG: hypothetical protein ACE5GE_00535 [Phycisphaerae bacterium]
MAGIPSGIPSDIAGSALQAGYQARNASKGRDAERATAASNADKSAKAIDEADTTVETGDSDAAVYTDAEGAGSQGRVFSDDVEADEDEQSDGSDQDRPGNSDDQPHLDIQA